MPYSASRGTRGMGTWAATAAPSYVGVEDTRMRSMGRIWEADVYTAVDIAYQYIGLIDGDIYIYTRIYAHKFVIYLIVDTY